MKSRANTARNGVDDPSFAKAAASWKIVARSLSIFTLFQKRFHLDHFDTKRFDAERRVGVLRAKRCLEAARQRKQG